MDATTPDASTQTKIVEGTDFSFMKEFQYLLEKSQQLFAGLRDLPPTGRNWQPYFQRTFEVYTKLWKFQQEHRSILENPDLYGLKRWEIGELASKIGQLYYHYYLRTSETNYLFESFIFYDAIRERGYFRDVLDSKNPSLVIKKLRYYARFIVVCLLLDRIAIVKKLMEELTTLVGEYTQAFKPTDSAEWNVVLSEISTFLEAEKKLSPVDFEGNSLNTMARLKPSKESKEKETTARLKLQEVVLVGNYQNQIKFSELTLDMYRMLQSLEREPSSTLTVDKAPGDGSEKPEEDPANKRTNPHKYLLYRPTFAQLYLYLSTAFKDISESSAFLLYISADGAKKDVKSNFNGLESGYGGGVATAMNLPRKFTADKDMEPTALIHCLHPNDLIPFTRKPMFLIIDSTNSTTFKNIPMMFSADFACLMSPTEYPTTIKDMTQIGSLFTLFLHSPVKGFAYISEATEMAVETWFQITSRVESMEVTIMEALEKNDSIISSIKRFMQDDFLKLFVIRYIFCLTLLKHHKSFKEPHHFPSIHPSLPSDMEQGLPSIIPQIKELVGFVNVGGHYEFEEIPAV